MGAWNPSFMSANDIGRGCIRAWMDDGPDIIHAPIVAVADSPHNRNPSLYHNRHFGVISVPWRRNSLPMPLPRKPLLSASGFEAA